MKLHYTGLNCIVTGGAGFIGQNIVNHLIELGANVYVIDNFSYGAKRSSIHTNAHVYRGNMVQQESFTTLPSIDYRYMFHFAGPSSVVLFNKAPGQCISETVSGFLNAIEFCSERSIKIIFPSSGSLYAKTLIPQQETSILNLSAMNRYARAKYSLEQIQASYGTTCDSLALRIFAGYGVNEEHKGDTASVIYSFCKKIWAKEHPTIYGDGKQERDFIYIADLIDAIVILAEQCNEKIINIGSGTSISFTKLVSMINTVTGTNIEPIYIKKPNGYLEKTLADTSLLKTYFNKTMTPLEEGITNILQSL